MGSFFLIGFRILGGMLTLFVFLLVVMRLAAPWPVRVEEVQQAEVAAVMKILRASYQNAHSIYLSVDGHNPDESMLKTLHINFPNLHINSIKEQSNTNNHCNIPTEEIIPMGTCESDNFLQIRFLTMPFWRVGLVNINTAACRNEFTLFKGLSSWHVISYRWLCS